MDSKEEELTLKKKKKSKEEEFLQPISWQIRLYVCIKLYDSLNHVNKSCGYFSKSCDGFKKKKKVMWVEEVHVNYQHVWWPSRGGLGPTRLHYEEFPGFKSPLSH